MWIIGRSYHIWKLLLDFVITQKEFVFVSKTKYTQHDFNRSRNINSFKFSGTRACDWKFLFLFVKKLSVFSCGVEFRQHLSYLMK